MRSISFAVDSALAAPSSVEQSAMSPAPTSVTGGEGIGAGVIGPGPGDGVGVGATVLLPPHAPASPNMSSTSDNPPARLLMFDKAHYCPAWAWCIVASSAKCRRGR